MAEIPGIPDSRCNKTRPKPGAPGIVQICTVLQRDHEGECRFGSNPVAPVPPECTPADRAVVVHLVRLIQDSADVRYYVGGAGSQMRVLLLAALTAMGVEDPAEVLKPPPHRRDDLTHAQHLQKRVDDLEAGRG